jgi:Ca2+-binding RTX toxin-like protein
LTGGNGADHFVFDVHSGADIITDFNANGQDIVDLASVLFDSVDDVLSSLDQVGQDVILHINDATGDSITFQKVTLANLDASDFHLF